MRVFILYTEFIFNFFCSKHIKLRKKMKKLIVLFSSLNVSFLFSQDLTKDLSVFTQVKVYDKITAELVKSDQNKIEVYGALSFEVVIIQKNYELKIRLPITKTLKGDEIRVKIYYTQPLDEIAAFEGSFITSAQLIKSRDLEITAKEGSEIKLDIEIEDLEAKATTGGEIYLNGLVSGTMNADVRMGGTIEAKKLKTKKTKVSVSMGGNANVYATDYAKAKTNAGGTINIYGNPNKTETKNFAGGTINLVKD